LTGLGRGEAKENGLKKRLKKKIICKLRQRNGKCPEDSFVQKYDKMATKTHKTGIFVDSHKI